MQRLKPRTGDARCQFAPWTPATKFGAGITAVVAPDRVRLSRNQALLKFLQDRLK